MQFFGARSTKIPTSAQSNGRYPAPRAPFFLRYHAFLYRLTHKAANGHSELPHVIAVALKATHYNLLDAYARTHAHARTQESGKRRRHP